MKIIEKIDRSKEVSFSYEIVPPPRGRSIKDIIDVVETLSSFDPPWIDVTSHSSTAYFREKNDGSIQKRVVRKRPGTLGICGIIQNRYKIDTVAHILCLGFSREETEDALIELNFMGIHNVLALRGDAPNFKKEIRSDRTVNHYSADLVSQIKAMSNGQFIEDIENSDPLDFCVGVAGYPEKHFEAPSLKQDIINLKKKVDAGADYIVTQMFYDNKKFFAFVEACRAAGITVPIIPGLKVLRSAAQLSSVPRTFHIDLPDVLVDEVTANPSKAGDIGVEWAIKQAQELIDNGFKNLHYYVLNDVELVSRVVKAIKK